MSWLFYFAFLLLHWLNIWAEEYKKRKQKKPIINALETLLMRCEKRRPTIGILCALCASYTEHSFLHSDVIVKGAVNSDATAFYSSNFLLSPFLCPFRPYLLRREHWVQFSLSKVQNKLVHVYSKMLRPLSIFICFEACIVHTYKVIVLSMHLLKDRTPHSLD